MVCKLIGECHLPLAQDLKCIWLLVHFYSVRLLIIIGCALHLFFTDIFKDVNMLVT
jgi:hypothetical protein